MLRIACILVPRHQQLIEEEEEEKKEEEEGRGGGGGGGGKIIYVSRVLLMTIISNLNVEKLLSSSL